MCYLRRTGDGTPTGDVSRSCQGGVVFRSVKASLDAGNGDRTLRASIQPGHPCMVDVCDSTARPTSMASQHTRRQPSARHLVERREGYSVKF